MKVHCNKRTLKKRVRKMMSLSIFITAFLFSCLLIYLLGGLFLTITDFTADNNSYGIAQTMNSQEFLKLLEIKSLENFDENSLKSKEWLMTLKNSNRLTEYENLRKNSIDNHRKSQIDEPIENIQLKKNEHMLGGLGLIFDMNLLVNTNISINGNMIYDSKKVDPKNNFKSPISSQSIDPDGVFKDFFNIKSEYTLFDLNQNQIGSVTAVANPEFIVILYIGVILIVAIIALISIFIGNLVSKFLAFPIIVPLMELEYRIKEVAEYGIDENLSTHIVVKKPLKEIELLVNSTNKIIDKMKNYSDILNGQKVVLEHQNEELEAQNEELVESKKQIEDTQNLLIQIENMASIGQLSAAITHEINTPIGAISSNSQFGEILIAAIESNDVIKSEKNLEELISQLKENNSVNIMACQRISEIIKSLKTFSRIDQAEYQYADINDSIKSVLVLTSNLWKRKITIHEEYGDFGTIKCFPGLLNQVIMNIIVNAIQSIDTNGDIYIKTYGNDKYVNISIRDTGCGIKDDHVSKLFDYGFTTKGVGIGMGLGLSISQNIIKKHDGDIVVNSKLGEGTEFIIMVPKK